MNVIKRKTLEAFWKGNASSKSALLTWFKICRKARWNNISDVRKTYPSADPVKVKSGKTATVFNLGGNNVRVITLIQYDRAKMLITHVLTHAEYNKNLWKDQI